MPIEISKRTILWNLLHNNISMFLFLSMYIVFSILICNILTLLNIVRKHFEGIRIRMFIWGLSITYLRHLRFGHYLPSLSWKWRLNFFVICLLVIFQILIQTQLIISTYNQWHLSWLSCSCKGVSSSKSLRCFWEVLFLEVILQILIFDSCLSINLIQLLRVHALSSFPTSW